MSQSKDSSKQVAIIVAALLAVVGGAWLFLNKGDEQDQQQTAMVAKSSISSFPEEESKVRMPIDTAMQMAEMAFQSGAIVEPEDASAMYFYSQVLQQEPENTRAKAGMSLIASQLIDEVNDALAKNDYENVVVRVEWLNRVAPENEELKVIRETLSKKSELLFTQLNKAIRARLFDEAERLAKVLHSMPAVDPGRVSSSMVEIAKARRVYEERMGKVETARMDAQRLDAEPLESVNVVALNQDSDRLDDANVATVTPVSTQLQKATLNNISTHSSTTQGGTTPIEELPLAVTESSLAASGGTATLATFVPEPVDQITPLLTEAQRHVENKQYFEPDNDNALHYYNQVLAIDSGNADAKRGLRSLVQNMTSKAYDAAEKESWDVVAESLDFAESVGIAGSMVLQARDDIKGLRFEAENGKSVSINNLTPQKTVPPKYPKRAISRSVEGWVKVSFLVAENGSTDEIEVLESSKQYGTQFSRAAVSAVAQWQFKPLMFEGQAVTGRTETTVQFKITD